jgi:hypothetical protein
LTAGFSLALSAFSGAAALFELELYRSEYQPPPFRMNPVPREICRRALARWQLGHSVSALSLMDCSASHSWWQTEHAYSYVGIVVLLRSPAPTGEQRLNINRSLAEL